MAGSGHGKGKFNESQDLGMREKNSFTSPSVTLVDNFLSLSMFPK